MLSALQKAAAQSSVDQLSDGTFLLEVGYRFRLVTARFISH